MCLLNSGKLKVDTKNTALKSDNEPPNFGAHITRISVQSTFEIYSVTMILSILYILLAMSV